MSKEQPFDPQAADIPELERGVKSLRFTFWFVATVSYPFLIVLALLVHQPIVAALVGVLWLVAIPLLRWLLVRIPSQQLSEARAAQGLTAASAFGRPAQVPQNVR